MKYTKFSDIIKKYSPTEHCEIDVLLLAKKWNRTYSLSQWHDEFKLIKHLRTNTPESTVLKVSISNGQAYEIIKKLNLKQEKSGIFRHGSTWRK